MEKRSNFSSKTIFQRQWMAEPSNFMFWLQLFYWENLVTYYV